MMLLIALAYSFTSLPVSASSSMIFILLFADNFTATIHFPSLLKEGEKSRV